jgi:hypothetical protein
MDVPGRTSDIFVALRGRRRGRYFCLYQRVPSQREYRPSIYHPLPEQILPDLLPSNLVHPLPPWRILGEISQH